MVTAVSKMNVEIWSDIMCPFCYLGKRKFENALTQFSNRENINVVWKSFMLNPDLKTDTSITIYDYLSKVKGFSPGSARQVNEQVAQSGRQVGLEYNFDRVIVANTFKAHLLLHHAKKQDKQNEVKESLFRAFFTEGKNTDDVRTLMEIGKEAGLNMEEFSVVLENDTYVDEFREDIYDAQQFGIRGVPFFIFDRKFGVSGAQESSVLLETLEKAYAGWRENNPESAMEVLQGESCNVDGDCSQE